MLSSSLRPFFPFDHSAKVSVHGNAVFIELFQQNMFTFNFLANVMSESFAECLFKMSGKGCELISSEIKNAAVYVRSKMQLCNAAVYMFKDGLSTAQKYLGHYTDLVE